MDLPYLELTGLAELIKSRHISSVDATETLLARIDALNPELKAYLHVGREAALVAANAADAELAQGHYRGPLHGVPIAVKDLCYTTDAPTTGGMPIYADHVPSYDATVVTRLRNAGAVILGKLCTTEGAFTSNHPDVPVPVNPWDADTWSGASSNGSGVATAAGLCYASLGSDTGGSIRLPSSMNGLTGVKPTWGRVSRYGVFELAASLDHIGPMCRSAADCAAVLEVIAGADPHDPTASLRPVEPYLSQLTLRSYPRVGIDRSLAATFDAETNAMLESVAATLTDLGWTVTDVATPDLPAAAADFGPLCAVETAYAHRETYPAKADQYGPALRDLIELGRGMSATDFQELQERRRAFTGRLRRLFSDIDILLIPGIGFASPTIETMAELGSNPELLAACINPTAPFDLAGNPTVTMPGGFTDRGTPLAFQFVGADFSEGMLLAAAHAYQQVTDHHRQHPAL